MRDNKGITLVSLVVTIIVLIILAGVSINLTLGENGIITMAKRARENMELAKVDEERQLNELYAQIVTEGGSSGNASDDAIIRLAEFKREIATAITDMGIETAENADASTMSSNIRSILGTATADKVGYDNTNSNLVATNVQGAVDEVNNNVNNLDSNLNKIIIKKSHYTEKQTLPTGNSTINVTAPTVEGYTPLTLVAAQSNSTQDIWVTHDNNCCRVYNNSGSQRENFYLNVVWLYIKNEFN